MSGRRGGRPSVGLVENVAGELAEPLNPAAEGLEPLEPLPQLNPMHGDVRHQQQLGLPQLIEPGPALLAGHEARRVRVTGPAVSGGPSFTKESSSSKASAELSTRTSRR